MRNFLVFLTCCLIQFTSCKNDQFDKYSDLTVSENHNHHNHNFINPVEPKVGEELVKLKTLEFETNKFYLLPNDSFPGKISIDTLRKLKLALISPNFIQESKLIHKIVYKGDYGCYNNVIKLEASTSLNCGDSNVYAYLDRFALHSSGQHIPRTPNHYLVFSSVTDLNTFNNTLMNNINNDRINYLEFDNIPEDLTCGSTTIKIFRSGNYSFYSLPNH